MPGPAPAGRRTPGGSAIGSASAPSRSASSTRGRAFKKIEASEELLVRGSVGSWLEEVTALQACTEQPWCRLRQEAVRREQTRLVHTYLRSRPEAGNRIRPPPKRHIDFLGAPFTSVVPKDTLPLIDELRLRVRYDIQLDELRESGWSSAEQSGWAPACRPESLKKSSLKDFCARLGIRPRR